MLVPNYCSSCNIEDKLWRCCGMHPETRERKPIEIDGKESYACPHLNIEARCELYSLDPKQDKRPRICKTFECDDIVYGRF